MTSLVGSTNFDFSALNSAGFPSLFINTNSEANFPQGLSSNPDFARMLVAQIQNESLKMLGVFGGQAQTGSTSGLTNSTQDLLSALTGTTSSFETQEGFGFLNTSATTEESESLFTDQMLSILRLEQIKVFQGLLGKKVKARTLEGGEITGVVENIVWENNQFLCIVDGKKVAPTSISEILLE